MPVTKKKDSEQPLETRPPVGDFWQRISLEELARRQGVQPVERFEDLLGGWPEDQIDDGFEEALARWHQESLEGTRSKLSLNGDWRLPCPSPRRKTKRNPLK